MFETCERTADGNQRDLGDRQDLFIVFKVLKYMIKGSPDYFYRKDVA